MRTACWTTVLLLVCVCFCWSAETATGPAIDLTEQMREFERNTALGAALSMRRGTPDEYEEVRTLAGRGLEAAREAVAAHPDLPEAHYLLGSWLLYGYRVVEAQIITSDPVRGSTTQTVSRVAQGPADTPEEGLAAFLKVTELAPTRGDYLLDYAAALGDYERPVAAIGILKKAWAGEGPLTPEEKVQAGLLLSDAHAILGQMDAAREWVYAALALEPAGARAVTRLRYLDAARAAAAAEEEWVRQEEAEAAAEEGYGEEEWQESEQGYEEGYEEGYWEESEEESDEAQSQWDEEGSGTEYEGEYEGSQEETD